MTAFSPLLWNCLVLSVIFFGRANAGTVAWFYALDQDKAKFEEVVGKPLRSFKSGTCTMHEYQVGPHRIVASKMGSGCVTTATVVATVMALNSASRVISTGPAGMIRDGMERGAWLRISQVSAWQKGKAEGGGRIDSGEGEAVPYDEADWPSGVWKSFNSAPLTSGEAFVASDEVRAALCSTTKASLVEMNAFGLLKALEGRNIKLLILRVASDRADGRASEDFNDFVKHYDGQGGQMVADLVKALPIGQDEPSAHEALKELLGR